MLPSSRAPRITDRPTLVRGKLGETDEDISESRAGMLGNKAWVFWTIAGIGGALFVGIVVGALGTAWSPAAKSSAASFETQLQALNPGQLPFWDADDPSRPADRSPGDFKNITCPFLSSLINEGVLEVKSRYTKEELRDISLGAGLAENDTARHIMGHFMNNPSDTQDIFSMEGASNEHMTSTGIHYCPTMYFDCSRTGDGDRQFWQCSNQTLPCEFSNEQRFDMFFSEIDMNQDDINEQRFDMFFSEIDTNQDDIMTGAELGQAMLQSSNVSFVDVNPTGLGNVRGSYMSLITVFGTPRMDGGFPDNISKRALRSVLIHRMFPEYYEFPGLPPPPPFTHAFAACGRPNNCRENVVATDVNRMQNIVCVSDTEKDGWRHYNTDGWKEASVRTCPTPDNPLSGHTTVRIWWESDGIAPDGSVHDPLWGGCRRGTFFDAQAFCSLKGARLPRLEEAELGCVATAGCGCDEEMIWTGTQAALPAGIAILKSVRSGYNLHVSDKSERSGDPVFHADSTTDGSKWHIKYVGSSGSMVMLKSVRSGYYLHVSDQSMGDGDPVFHTDSTSEGSHWLIEYVGSSGSMMMLKSARSGYYLHVASGHSLHPQCAHSGCLSSGDSAHRVFHASSTSDGSKWQLWKHLSSLVS